MKIEGEDIAEVLMIVTLVTASLWMVAWLFT